MVSPTSKVSLVILGGLIKDGLCSLSLIIITKSPLLLVILFEYVDISSSVLLLTIIVKSTTILPSDILLITIFNDKSFRDFLIDSINCLSNSLRSLLVMGIIFILESP